MTTINNPVTPAAVQSKTPVATPVSQPSVQSQAASDTFGPATDVNLSPPAQTAVSEQSTSSATAPSDNTKTSTNTQQAPAAAASSSAANTESLISSAKRKVIPQVGVAGANEVVDKNGRGYCVSNDKKVWLASLGGIADV
jgi:hypothetical protein